MVQQPQKRIFREQLPVQGTVKPVEYATISAKISGTLELLNVSEGDKRKTGDVLFGIDRQILKNQVVVKEDEINVKEAALKSAELQLKTAQINQTQAKRDYERALTLAKSNALSQSNLETNETEYKRAEMEVQSALSAIVNARAQLKQAQSNLAIAKKNLDDSVVRAPFDCVVFEKFVEANEFVSVGQDILKLENPDKLEVSCYISAAYYHKVVPGKTVAEFTDGDGKALGRAVVTYRAPGVDPESRTFELKAIVPKDVKLVSGMLCDMNLILTEKEAYGLPTDSMLLRANDRYIVFTVDQNKRAQAVTVARGIIDGSYCELLNAPELLGKDVVISGQTFVNNNALLSITNAAKK
jgi:multidrug efflux pump subunit AcrA (membrane-fusion protein)